MLGCLRWIAEILRLTSRDPWQELAEECPRKVTADKHKKMPCLHIIGGDGKVNCIWQRSLSPTAPYQFTKAQLKVRPGLQSPSKDQAGWWSKK